MPLLQSIFPILLFLTLSSSAHRPLSWFAHSSLLILTLRRWHGRICVPSFVPHVHIFAPDELLLLWRIALLRLLLSYLNFGRFFSVSIIFTHFAPSFSSRHLYISANLLFNSPFPLRQYPSQSSALSSDFYRLPSSRRVEIPSLSHKYKAHNLPIILTDYCHKHTSILPNLLRDNHPPLPGGSIVLLTLTLLDNHSWVRKSYLTILGHRMLYFADSGSRHHSPSTVSSAPAHAMLRLTDNPTRPR